MNHDSPRRALGVVWATALLGLALSGLAAVLARDAFLHAWLAACVVFSGWPLGSLALLLIHPLTGGRWGDALAPALRLGAALTPLLALLWIPIVLGLGHVYPWVDSPPQNAWYLNLHDASLRGAGYLALWLLLSALVLAGLHRLIAGPALILLGLSVNFAAIDATLSLQPDFNSSDWGMTAASGMVLLALAVATALTGPALHRHTRADAAKLMLALLCLWQYLDFMQFLIVWQSDLPTEAAWLGPRLYGTWGVVMALVAVDHFLLPLAILVVPAFQRSMVAVLAACLLIVLGEALRSWWIVLPAGHLTIGWPDLAAMIGVNALGAALVLTARASRPALRAAKPAHA